METKANYVAVGLFTLLLTLAGFGFVYWSSGIGAGGDLVQLRVRIPGSAAGLGRGSAVLFNGVKVGDVRRVYIDVSSPTLAIAEAEIDRLTPITGSTRADIGLAGLTGQANIELKGGNPSEQSLIEQAEAVGKVAEITANPSAVTNLLQTAQDIFARADSVLTTLEGFATDVRGPLTDTASNIAAFSGALGRNAEGIESFLSNVTKMSQTLGTVSGRLDATLAAAEELIKAVDRDKVGTIVTNFETFTARLEGASSEFEGIIKNVDQAAASIRDLTAGAGGTLSKVDGMIDGLKTGVDTTITSIGRVAEGASGTLARVDGILDRVKPEQVESAIANIEGATADARTAAANVAALADRFGKRADDIDRIISGVDTSVANISKVTGAASGTLARVDGMIDGLKTGVDTTVANIGRVTGDASGTLARVDGILDRVKPEQVESAIANIEGATADARAAAADVAALAQRFGNRADDIDRIISDTRGIAEKLNQASTRVDGVLAKVDTLLGSGEAEGVMSEANETLRSFRQVADTLNSRLAGILDGLSRFSGQGLREVEALVRDSRRSITRIEGAINSFERNPQRILSGGDGAVREFDGRARR